MNIEKRTKSIDLSHHLSEVSKARVTSPLKGLQKYFSQPGILTLAGG
jgi:aromatic amino acid aminotransferase I